jgi:long-chain fatty acid transport protein
MRNRHVAVLALIGCLASASPASAGGYDTPILYTARHIGMGGAAIGYVSDPSALFHNPAGMSHTESISLMANFSPLLGKIKASPHVDAKSVESELTFAPFFLVGATFRVTDWLTLGLAAYPVASAGATFEYDNTIGTKIVDKTKLVFIEISPGLSFDIPGNLRFGIGYRLSIISLDRIQEPADGTGKSMFNMSLKGINALGFRAGLQWQPMKNLQLGLTYRHKTSTEISAESSELVFQKWGKTTMDVTLPSKLGFGVRYDAGPMGFALDTEWSFNSQNASANIKAVNPDASGDPLDLQNEFQWSDALTVRVGTEYRFLDRFSARLGYIFDDITANKNYPTAFGTPAAATHSITAGMGYDAGPWQVNLAYAHRMGSVTITAEDLDFEGRKSCLPCGKEGSYDLKLHGVYVDFSYNFK